MDTYEKKYKNALTIAKSRFKVEKDESVLTCLGMMFPELRESEDERIRRTLVEYFGPEVQLDFVRGVPIQKIRDWLEKQKPVIWSKEDENIRKFLIWQVHRNIEDETNDLAQSVYDGIKGHDPDLEESIEDWKKCLAWLKSLSPSWKPSEEQMDALKDAIIYVESSESNFKGSGFLLESLFNNLQKL